jgi:hypothetical protein
MAPATGFTDDLLPPNSPPERAYRGSRDEGSRRVSHSNRESIREAIKALGPTAEGEVPALAIKLSSTFQQSGMTLQMIEDAIRQARTQPPPVPAE